MPKKFPIGEKRKWLEQYEAGKSEVAIAKANRCDTRTVKKGIEEARRERDARIARTELFKQALLEHHHALLQKLKELTSPLIMPPRDWVPLSWYRNGESIFTDETKTAKVDTFEAQKPIRRTAKAVDLMEDMLRQHLRGDKLLRALANRENAYIEHRRERVALQRKVVAILQDATGCKVVDRNDVPPPFLYSYTAGYLFFRMTLRYAFGDYQSDEWQRQIIANASAGTVEHQGQILAEVPGREKRCRQKLLEAFEQMKQLPEATRVVKTYQDLEEATLKVKAAAEEILALGVVPGQCKLCQRLGT